MVDPHDLFRYQAVTHAVNTLWVLISSAWSEN